MTGSGDKRASETQRQCAVTRVHGTPDELLRFVRDPDGNLVPDLKGKLPGRGVWLSCSRIVVEKALKTRAFDKSFRQPVKPHEFLVDQVESLIERDCLQRLSLANKAGDVVCGFDKVSNALRKGGVVGLVHASDAAAGGRGKLDRLFFALAKGAAEPRPVIDTFNAEQLSLALGQPNVVHAALKKGGPVEKFLQAMARLEKFRGGSNVTAAA